MESEYKEARLLRIFIGESDKSGGEPVYEKIVKKAYEEGLAGATVYRGIMGYGGRSRIHTHKILRLSEDLPLVIEIVDSAEKIDKLMPFIEELFKSGAHGGLLSIEKATIKSF